MAIHLRILTELNERKLRKDADDLRRNYQAAGDDAGRLYGKGLQNAFREVESAQKRHLSEMEKAAKAAQKTADDAVKQSTAIRKKASDDARKMVADNAKAVQDGAKAEIEAQKKLTASQERTAKAGRANMNVTEARLKSQQALVRQTELVRAVEEARRRGMGDEAKLAVQLADEEEKLTKLRETDVRLSRRQIDVQTALRAARRTMKDDIQSLTEAEHAHAMAVQDSGLVQVRAARTVTDAEAEAQRTITRAHQEAQARISSAHMHTSHDIIRANKDLDQSLISNAKSMKDNENRLADMWEKFNQLGKQTRWFAESLRIAASPVAFILLADAAKAAATAAQSIAFLPAIVSAAGAGFLTLTLATQGFSDALGDMGDPEKWAEGLAKLSPAAQQSALEIKKLVDGPIHEMQQATSEAFFAGLPEQMDRIATVLGPSIQGMTTGIAGSINQALSGVGSQLTSAQGQFDVSMIAHNIQSAFDAALPAVNSLVQAFLDLTEVGSEFLPGMGQGLADLARSFADWIREARTSGDLKRWMQEGWDGVVALKNAAVELAGALKDVYDLFTAGRGVNGFYDDMVGLHEVTSLLNGDLDALTAHDSDAGWSDAFTSGAIQNFGKIIGKCDELRIVLQNLPGFFTAVGNEIISMLNQVVDGINGALNNIPLVKLAGGVNIPHVDPLKKPDAAAKPGDTRTPQQKANDQAGDGRFSNKGYSNTGPDAAQVPGEWTNPTTGQKKIFSNKYGWLDPSDPRAADASGDYSPSAVPLPAPKNADGSKMSDSDKLKAAMAGIDPSQYKIDAAAPLPGIPIAGSLGKVAAGTGTPLPGGAGIPGYASVDQQAVLEAQHDIEMKAHDLEQDKLKRLAMEKLGTYTAQEISEAKWKEQEDAWALQKAQADLVDKQRGTTQKLKAGANDFGAALDADFGLSKGLPGLAENITKFVGNLLISPMMAAGAQVQASSPYQGGFGLFGMMSAQNLANGKSPLLGRDLPPGYAGATTGPGGVGGAAASVYNPDGSLGPQGLGNYMTGYMGDQNLLARAGVRPGGHYEVPGDQFKGAWDLSQNIGDCTSSIEDLVATIDGKPTMGRSMSTHNADSWLAQNGFLPGEGGPGDFRVGYNDHHMQATLPGGTNFNYGSEAAAQAGGVAPNSGAAYGSQHWYRPMGIAAPLVPVAPGGPPAGAPVPLPGGAPTPVSQMPTSQNPGLTPIGRWTGGPVITPGGSLGDDSVGMLWGNRASGRAGQLPPGNFNPNMKIDTSTTSISGYPGMWPGEVQGPDSGLDKIPARLTRGEHVLDRGDVAQMGGQQAVYDFRRRLHGYWTGGAPNENDHGNNPSGSPGPGNDAGGTRIGGLAPAHVAGGGGGVGITPGGTIDTALNLAASAFPGVGQAAATGMKLASRAVEYAGQAAAIGASGLMETFLPAGGSELANNSWFTRILGGLASASPAIANVAGGALGQQQMQGANPSVGGPTVSPPPLTPEGIAAAGMRMQAQGANPGAQQPITNNITFHTPPDTSMERASADYQYHQSKTAAAGMPNGARAGNGP